MRRIAVKIQLRKEDDALSIHERIAPHVVQIDKLFEGQSPPIWRGWGRAYLDHLIHRFREADQEAANADHGPVFLEAEQATVAIRLPPRLAR